MDNGREQKSPTVLFTFLCVLWGYVGEFGEAWSRSWTHGASQGVGWDVSARGPLTCWTLCLCSRQAAPCVQAHLKDDHTPDSLWPALSVASCHEEFGAEWRKRARQCRALSLFACSSCVCVASLRHAVPGPGADKLLDLWLTMRSKIWQRAGEGADGWSVMGWVGNMCFNVENEPNKLKYVFKTVFSS